jgi:hypothetical protein
MSKPDPTVLRSPCERPLIQKLMRRPSAVRPKTLTSTPDSPPKQARQNKQLERLSPTIYRILTLIVLLDPRHFWIRRTEKVTHHHQPLTIIYT